MPPELRAACAIDSTSRVSASRSMVILPAAESTATSRPANTSPVWIELAVAFSVFRLTSWCAVTALPGPVASCSAATPAEGSAAVASTMTSDASWAAPRVSLTSGARPAETLPVIATVWALMSTPWPVIVAPVRASATPAVSGSAGSWV